MLPIPGDWIVYEFRDTLHVAQILHIDPVGTYVRHLDGSECILRYFDKVPDNYLYCGPYDQLRLQSPELLI